MDVFSGDQVLEWNGRVLQGATFNEVYNIILESKSEAQVELVVSRLIRWVPKEPAVPLCRNALLSFFCHVFRRDVHRVADGAQVVQMNSSEFITQEEAKSWKAVEARTLRTIHASSNTATCLILCVLFRFQFLRFSESRPVHLRHFSHEPQRSDWSSLCKFPSMHCDTTQPISANCHVHGVVFQTVNRRPLVPRIQVTVDV